MSNYFTHFETRKLHREYEVFLKEKREPWSSNETFRAFCDLKGWEFASEHRIGRIGRGDKNHKISCDIGIDDKGREYIFSAHSFCGSQRWTAGGRSGIILVGGTKECDCKKCNK